MDSVDILPNGDYTNCNHVALHGVEGTPQGGDHGRQDRDLANKPTVSNDDVRSRFSMYGIPVGTGRYGLDTIRTHME